MLRCTWSLLIVMGICAPALAYPKQGSEERFTCPAGLKKQVDKGADAAKGPVRLSCLGADGRRQGQFLEYGANAEGRYHVQGQYTAGAMTGLWRSKVGMRVLEADVDEGKLNGQCRFYRDGLFVEEVTLREGMPDGLWKQFHGNGQLRAALTYKDGRAHGLLRVFDRRGLLRELGVFVDGKLVPGSRIYLSPGGQVSGGWEEARTREGWSPPERPAPSARPQENRPRCVREARRAFSRTEGFSGG